MRQIFIYLVASFYSLHPLMGQDFNSRPYIDSLVKANSVPGLIYAIFRNDSILSYGSFGLRNISKSEKLSFSDIMPIGSCSKSVTGLLATKLVSQGYINWETDFFNLYPELLRKKNKYQKLTFINLLSHRAEVPSLTGQNNEKMPDMKLLLDTTSTGRLNLAKWILKQQPIKLTKTYSYSNGGYVLAALMMEKVTGKTWEQLVYEHLNSQSITSYFNFPNEIDTNNVWLHDERIYPVSPESNSEAGVRKPLAAGGLIFMTCPDAIKYIQLNMKGSIGESSFLTKSEFQFAHSGLPEYALGWGNRDVNGELNIIHRGNIGGRSWCLFQFIPSKSIGVVIMTNSGDQQTGKVINEIRDYLIERYKQ
jgi:CubicO group peptidase (beta-lactamase class C family)